ncbi:DUF4340 domain-containing protein [Sediminicoccus sp. KRV36]|uniref:DUF4340 domain-containing protein n=1 Tax=Sediminicoccus sp. KRV36 TaxID=3133721 RepID=UPI00200DF194|nr:DUF4340 domain-containing protein [Sediminicoccus rosea]UPY35565.1 DUF4340 domain-containing protein [Sediminicoccus rosea]
MIGKRSLALLAGAAAASLGGAFLLRPEGESQGQIATGTLAFPGLAARLTGAARIEIKRGAQSTTLIRDGESWGIAESQGYPARAERIREMLTGLTELRLMEERSGEPGQWSRLGVEDPLAAGSTAALLRVLNATGGVLAELILGRRRVRTQGNLPESVYVRRPGESRAWLAEGRIGADADPSLWINRDIANLAPARLRRVEIARNGAPPLVLARAGEVDAPLDIITPEDAPVADRVALDEVGRAFDMLTFVEVRPATDSASEAVGEALGETRFHYTDDVTITARPSREGELFWVRLSAAGGEEAQQLQARFQGWAFQLGLWKEKAMIPRVEDLAVT